MDDPQPLPNIVDLHGQLRDPYFGNPLGDGQEGPGSIFYVPSSGEEKDQAPYQLYTGKDETQAFPDMMETLRKAGFQGEKFFLHVTPRPQDLDRVPSPPPPESDRYNNLGIETSVGNIYRTQCAYCWAIVRGKERERGFKLHEIHQAAAKGCSTCEVLYRGIQVFADLIFPTYSIEKVRVRQKENGKSRFLSQTKAVTVCFDEYEGETIKLTFDGSIEHRTADAKSEGIIEDTSSYAAVLLIKDWIHKCSAEHHLCAIPTASLMPMRVLEVSNCRARLVETDGLIAPYITLSHCWGLKHMYRLLKSNLDEMKRDIIWTNLSKTFQHAIMLTWRLGYRYIWIDALCILQNSLDDWEYHASKMAQIFSNSQLTISASSGANGSKGCFSSRLQEPYNLNTFDADEIRNPSLWMPRQLEGKDRDGCLRVFTVRLKAPHGLYQNRRPKEPLLKRAWVFQEQILSPRIVHFASGELYFECKSYLACECSGWSLRSRSHQWETRWRKSHTWLLGQALQPSESTTIREFNEKVAEFEAYRALIEAYTELDITNELDRLPALSGITFGRRDEYLAGMWRSLLIESLHWYPVSKSLRGMMARRTSSYRAPTWSWASIEAPIRHAESEFHKRRSNPKFVAKIIDASTTTVGVDPRGMVSGGYLRVQGPMAEVRVTAIGVSEREGSQSEEMLKTMAKISPESIDSSLTYRERNKDICTYAMLRKGSLEGRCYLDLPLALCRREPAEVTVGQELTCLVLSSTTLLVLRPVPDTPGTYTRVGFFQPKENGWIFETDRNSIFII